jgi:hypothetical protein
MECLICLQRVNLPLKRVKSLGAASLVGEADGSAG